MKIPLIISCFLLGVVLVNCNNRQRPKTPEISDPGEKKDTTLERAIRSSPFGPEQAMEFRQFSDSLIRSALNNKSASYALAMDTVSDRSSKNYYPEFFGSDSLAEVSGYHFSLAPPYHRYSFTLFAYRYTSEKSAFSALDKVATIAFSSYFGLTKDPAYIFRVDNLLFWLRAPHTLSGKSFNALQKKLTTFFAQSLIDEAENHVKRTSLSGFDREGLTGKWRLKLISPIFKDDTTKKENFEKYVMEIRNNSLRIDGKEYPIQSIVKLQVPDIQVFLAYNDYLDRENLLLNPVFRKYSGPVVKYSIFLEHHAVGGTGQANDALLQEDFLYNLIKISDREFGFIRNEAYYQLIKAG
jgi:hypothetical protein